MKHRDGAQDAAVMHQKLLKPASIVVPPGVDVAVRHFRRHPDPCIPHTSMTQTECYRAWQRSPFEFWDILLLQDALHRSLIPEAQILQPQCQQMLCRYGGREAVESGVDMPHFSCQSVVGPFRLDEEVQVSKTWVFQQEQGVPTEDQVQINPKDSHAQGEDIPSVNDTNHFSQAFVMTIRELGEAAFASDHSHQQIEKPCT